MIKIKFIFFIFLPLFLSDCGNVPAYAHPVDMDAICKIESNFNDNAKGSHGEIGRYQITPIVLKHFNQVHRDKKVKVFTRENPLKYGFKMNGFYDEHTGYLTTEIGFEKDTLFYSEVNTFVANWYMNWLFDRCWTVKDTIIAWNWGIGNWRKWKERGNEVTCEKIPLDICVFNQNLPKTTQAYLKKYENLTGERLS